MYHLVVPFVEKDEAKELGARWDSQAKKWYCYPDMKFRFAKWDPAVEKEPEPTCTRVEDEDANIVNDKNLESCLLCKDMKKLLCMVPCGHKSACRVCFLELTNKAGPNKFTKCPRCKRQVDEAIF